MEKPSFFHRRGSVMWLIDFSSAVFEVKDLVTYFPAVFCVVFCLSSHINI